MQKALNLLLGAILGGMVGGAVGLILAPMSGDELRMEIRDYSRQVRNDVDRAAKQRRAELELELANMRGEVVTS